MTTMPDVAGGWVRSLLGTLGGEFGQEILYLGRNDTLHTHLGYFGVSGRAGGSGRGFDNAYHQSVFPIRQAVPVGLARARFCSWACSARVFIEKK